MWIKCTKASPSIKGLKIQVKFIFSRDKIAQIQAATNCKEYEYETCIILNNLKV